MCASACVCMCSGMLFTCCIIVLFLGIHFVRKLFHVYNKFPCSIFGYFCPKSAKMYVRLLKYTAALR